MYRKKEKGIDHSSVNVQRQDQTNTQSNPETSLTKMERTTGDSEPCLSSFVSQQRNSQFHSLHTKTPNKACHKEYPLKGIVVSLLGSSIRSRLISSISISSINIRARLSRRSTWPNQVSPSSIYSELTLLVRYHLESILSTGINREHRM